MQFELKCLVEEIKMTNDIEGVASTRKEIEDALEAVRSHQEGKSRFMGIANKYLMLSSKGNDAAIIYLSGYSRYL